MKPVLVLALVLGCLSGLTTAGYWTRWFDFDDPTGSGDYERIQDHPTADNWRPCGGRVKERIQAREVGMPGSTISTKDHLVVGPSYGLYCSNGASSGYCQDYWVKYCTAADFCSPLKDVNDPGFKDDERRFLHGIIPANVEYILFGVTSSIWQYRVYETIKLSPRYGLRCLNSRSQSCKDYEVRYYCGDYPTLGIKTNG